MMTHPLILAIPLLAAAGSLLAAEDRCAQPSPEEMARAANVTLPKLPWHLAVVIWEFENPIERFESLEMDITIDRDVPSSYNLYISPCGGAKMNGTLFYGGIQTNINGWVNGENRERVHRGKGAIFSRWSNDRKTPIGLDHVRTAAADCLVESAGYEGEFASVRRPFEWSKGAYTWSIHRGEAETVDGQEHTWFRCQVKDSKGQVHEIGSLRFEGAEFTFAARNSAFVEVYGTSKIPRSGIPKVEVTFGWPRINGQKAALQSAYAYYKDKGTAASPDCAWVTAVGETAVVEVGPIFQRDESLRRQPLPLRRNP